MRCSPSPCARIRTQASRWRHARRCLCTSHLAFPPPTPPAPQPARVGGGCRGYSSPRLGQIGSELASVLVQCECASLFYYYFEEKKNWIAIFLAQESMTRSQWIPVAVHLPTPQRFQGNKYAVRLEEERLARRGAVRKWRMLLQDPEHARCCTHAQAGSRWQHSAQHQSELDLPPMEAPSGAAPPVRASPSRPKRPQGYARRNDRGK